MILVRNVFRLKFGKAREATALMQEGLGILRNAGAATVRDARLLTDLTGPFYTLVLEETFENLTAMEQILERDMRLPEWQAFYPRFTPLVESGYREVFTVVGSAVPPLGTAQGRAEKAATR
jgi:hypothetical protein